MHFKNYIFDLDNTLYYEVDYLFFAYQIIADKIADKNPYLNSDDLNNFLKKTFTSNGRNNLFNQLLQSFSINNFSVQNCLEILRTCKVEREMQLFADAYKVINDILSKKNKVFVVTNGNVVQQKNKVKNIDWHGMKDDIVFVFANNYKPKPSIESYCHIKNKYNISESSTIMVGDMISDMNYAKNIGVKFMYVENFYVQYIQNIKLIA